MSNETQKASFQSFIVWIDEIIEISHCKKNNHNYNKILKSD